MIPILSALLVRVFHPSTDHTILEPHLYVGKCLTPPSLLEIPDKSRNFIHLIDEALRILFHFGFVKFGRVHSIKIPNPWSSQIDIRIHRSYNFSIFLSRHDLSHIWIVDRISAWATFSTKGAIKAWRSWGRFYWLTLSISTLIALALRVIISWWDKRMIRKK